MTGRALRPSARRSSTAGVRRAPGRPTLLASMFPANPGGIRILIGHQPSTAAPAPARDELVHQSERSCNHRTGTTNAYACSKDQYVDKDELQDFNASLWLLHILAPLACCSSLAHVRRPCLPAHPPTPAQPATSPRHQPTEGLLDQVDQRGHRGCWRDQLEALPLKQDADSAPTRRRSRATTSSSIARPRDAVAMRGDQPDASVPGGTSMPRR